MHKRHLHHVLVRLRPVKYWYLVVVLIVSGFTAAFALRQNELRSLELRDELLKVDEQNGDIEGALRKLREHTYAHMSSRLSSDTGIYPPIQLKFHYERLVAAEKARVAGANESLYRDAQASCEARFPQGLSGGNRIPCIQQYLDSRGGAATEQSIPDSLYKFDFVAPDWSPDLAGWSLLVVAISFILLVVRIAADRWLHSRLDM